MRFVQVQTIIPHSFLQSHFLVGKGQATNSNCDVRHQPQPSAIHTIASTRRSGTDCWRRYRSHGWRSIGHSSGYRSHGWRSKRHSSGYWNRANDRSNSCWFHGRGRSGTCCGSDFGPEIVQGPTPKSNVEVQSI